MLNWDLVAEEMMSNVVKKGYLFKHARPGRGVPGSEWQKYSSIFDLLIWGEY